MFVGEEFGKGRGMEETYRFDVFEEIGLWVGFLMVPCAIPFFSGRGN